MYIGLSTAIVGQTNPSLPRIVSSLFSNGEQGVWYDPSDFSTLFQDVAGTIPVTAVGQPVGKILDKSGRGNHAYQSTSASRPVLSALVNQYLNTATLATQNVTTLATTYTLRFDGAGSITLSGTATGTYTAGVHSVVCAAGTLTSTVTGTVTNADLRPTNAGVNLPPYQRVGASTDYDTAGFPHYLKFDGIDDSLVTNSIDFTATDKMTVCAGVRKLSDVSVGILLELSPNINITTGAFYLAVPEFVNASGDYVYASRGTTVNIAARAAIKAPSTVVVTGTSSIASRSVILCINGAQAAINPTNQGTGNYGNYPLYIGRRGGTTFPFNGQLYGLVIRGALSSTGEIQGAESYMNLHTGAY